MKKLGISVVFMALLVLCIYITGYFLRPKSADRCINQINQFHSVDKNSLQVIALGSSHSWLGFDAKEFEKKTGMRTYNYSCYWQSFNTTNLFFNDALMSQKPEVVLIETGRINDVLVNREMEGQIYYTRAEKWSISKIKYLYQVFGRNVEQYIAYLLPIVSFHNNWEKDKQFSKFDDDTIIDEYGNNVSSKVYPLDKGLIGADVGVNDALTKIIEEINPYEGGEIGQCELSAETITIMNEITEKCNSKGIRLIWYTIPYAGDYNYSEAMKDYVDRNGGEYINLFDKIEEVGLDSQTDYNDSDHLNSRGAKKISVYLADVLTQD